MRCVLRAQNVKKSVCGQDSAADPAGGVNSAPAHPMAKFSAEENNWKEKGM